MDPVGLFGFGSLTLEWMCVPAGVWKEKKVNQHKNEINAVSIQVFWENIEELIPSQICLGGYYKGKSL